MTGSPVQLTTSQERYQFTERLKVTFGSVPDLVTRKVGGSFVVYIAGLVDQQRIEREIIDPLLSLSEQADESLPITTPSMQMTDDYRKTVDALLCGMAAVIVCGYDKIILASVASAPHRDVSAPETETVILGPREAFTEAIDTNVALIRRIMKSEKLRIKGWHIGSTVPTDVRLLYMEGIAEDKLVKEITERLDAVHTEAVLNSNYIVELIKDRPFSLFPTIQLSERPDVACAALMKEKVIVICDNSPFVLIAPFTFWNAFQSIEDYYLMYSSASFLRLIRAFFVIMALLLPSLYVAITTFHVEMLPTNLLLSIAASREHAPFPAMIEALIMESVFEALREAIVRLPRILSQAVSVVGALVIGQSVVQAGIVSIPTIIVVSITGIANLMIPRYEMTFAIRILRIMLLFMAGTFGFFGIAVGLFFTQAYLTGVRSFGTPYLTPVAPLYLKGMKDFFIRKPFGRKNH